MIARRLKCEMPLRASCTKWSSMARVVSKSATTPSISGATTATSRASRPCIFCASNPTAITAPVTLFMAMTDGSSTITPRPRTAMIVLAEPMSIAIESDTRLRNARRLMNELVLLMKDILFQEQMVNTIGLVKLSRCGSPVLQTPLEFCSEIASHLGRAAGTLPINLKEDHRLLAVFHRNGIACLKLVSITRGLKGRLADQNFAAPGIGL